MGTGDEWWWSRAGGQRLKRQDITNDMVVDAQAALRFLTL